MRSTFRNIFILFCILIIGKCISQTVPSINKTSVNSSVASPLLPSFNRSRFCSIKTTLRQLAFFICLIVFIPLTVIGNLFVCVVIISSPVLRRQTTYVFLLSLAVADSLIGMISMPIRAKSNWDNLLFCAPTGFCMFFLVEELITSITSVTHLLVIGLDRYISLKYVYEYKRIMTKKKLYRVIASIWIYSLLWALLGTFRWDKPNETSLVHFKQLNCYNKNKAYFTTIYVVCFIIPVAIMLYTYTYVFRIASKHINAIAKIEMDKASVKEVRRKKRQYRTLRSVVIVFVAFIIFWFPSIIFTLSMYYNTQFWRDLRTNHETGFYLIFAVITIFPMFNSTTNPFIYVLYNKQFRTVCKQLIWKSSLRKSASSAYLSTSGTNTTTLDRRLRDITTNKYKKKPKEVTSYVNNSLEVPSFYIKTSNNNGNSDGANNAATITANSMDITSKL